MDKNLIRKRFAKAAGSYDSEAAIQKDIARKMTGLIGKYVPADMHRNVLEIGCGTGFFTRLYADSFHPGRLWLNDLCPEMESFFSDMGSDNVAFLPGDAERIPLPEDLSLITSCSAIQWFEDHPRFFRNCAERLEQGGYIAFSTFGKENFSELSTVTGASLAYKSIDELRESLEGAFETVYSGEECIRMLFRSPMDVLEHIKKTGVTGVRNGRWTKGSLSSFCRKYSELYCRDGNGVSLSYHPVYMILKKR